MAKNFVQSILILLLAGTYIPGLGQDGCKCCSDKYREFDFWIGSWDVVDTLGNKVGENEITRIEEGCALTEKWTGAMGGTGTSINYYNPKEDTWNQLWVSSNGVILKLKGTATDGQMVLKSEPFTIDSTLCYNQIKWSKVSEGVRQEWAIYEESGKLKRKIFTGIYIKKDE